MKLGLWLTARYDPTRSPEAHFRAMRDQVIAARDGGFGIISSGQHHLAPRLQTLPLLARLMAEAGDMDVATSILLLPLHHPVDVAEETATMNAMLGGRFRLGVGLGHDPIERAAYGVASGDVVARFDEAVEVMRRVWAGSGDAYDGRFFTLPARPAPVASLAGPRLWIGGNSAAARRRAAALGAAWFPSGRDVDALVEGREGGALPAGDANVSGPPDQPAGLWMHIAETDAAAQRIAREAGHLDGASSHRRGYVIGSPETCLAALRDYRDRGGVSHLLCRLEVPGMEQRDVLARIELIGRSIIPALARG